MTPTSVTSPRLFQRWGDLIGIADHSTPIDPDPSDGDEGFYVLASDYISSDVESGINGRIASPYILGKDHPEVCFSFMVFFGVSIIRIIDVLQILK